MTATCTGCAVHGMPKIVHKREARHELPDLLKAASTVAPRSSRGAARCRGTGPTRGVSGGRAAAVAIAVAGSGRGLWDKGSAHVPHVARRMVPLNTPSLRLRLPMAVGARGDIPCLRRSGTRLQLLRPFKASQISVESAKRQVPSLAGTLQNHAVGKADPAAATKIPKRRGDDFLVLEAQRFMLQQHLDGAGASVRVRIPRSIRAPTRSSPLTTSDIHAPPARAASATALWRA